MQDDKDTDMHPWISAFFSLSILSLLLSRIFQGCALRRLQQPLPPPPETPLPGVSVFKPLTGLDEQLLENLVTFAEQDYPTYELLFGVASLEDPSCAVVRQLQQRYPNRQIRLCVGYQPLGYNPKVNNLANIARFAQYDLWLISDANVEVETDYLRTMVAELHQPNVGLVTSLLGARHGRSLGALWEDLHLATMINPLIAGAHTLGNHPCVVGKSVLFRRAQFMALGGLSNLAYVLAEDYLMGQMFHQAGFRVIQSRQPVRAVHVQRSTKDFFARHTRWAQMRRRIKLSSYLGEPLLYTSLWLIGLLITSSVHQQGWLMAWAMLGLVYKCQQDNKLMQHFSQRRLTLFEMISIPAKDCLVTMAWVVGFFQRHVTWRNHTFRIAKGSRLTPVQTQNLPNWQWPLSSLSATSQPSPSTLPTSPSLPLQLHHLSPTHETHSPSTSHPSP